MGDRTDCVLRLFGFIHSDDIRHLAGVVEDADEIQDIEKSLRDGNNHLPFLEINFANMDSQMAKDLAALGLGWAWSWDAGHEFGSGIELYNPATDMHAEYEFNTKTDEILLPLGDVENPLMRDEARKWDTLMKRCKLRIYESNHDFLEKVNSKDLSTEERQIAKASKRAAA